MVTLYTTSFNINNYYTMPPECLYDFLWISAETGIIFLYSINGCRRQSDLQYKQI